MIEELADYLSVSGFFDASELIRRLKDENEALAQPCKRHIMPRIDRNTLGRAVNKLFIANERKAANVLLSLAMRNVLLRTPERAQGN